MRIGPFSRRIRAMDKKQHGKPSKGGRPAKFAEPSRPVTMTLPDRILARLAEIDADRARAVVKAVESALGAGGQAREPVAELSVAPDEALLEVARSPALARLPWLRLIEIAPGRHLISLSEGVPVEKLEVALEDLLDGTGAAGTGERRMLRALLDRIRTPRRNRAVRTEQILVIRTAATSSGNRPEKGIDTRARLF